MHYPAEYGHTIKHCRKERSLEEVRSQTPKNIETEYEVTVPVSEMLCQAEIPETVFYLKKKKMDRYSDIWACTH